MQVQTNFLEHPRNIENFRQKEGVNFVYLGEVIKPADTTNTETALIHSTNYGIAKLFTCSSRQLAVYSLPIRVYERSVELATDLGIYPIATILDGGKFVRVDEKMLETLTTIATDKVPLSHLPLRKGVVKFASFLQWVVKTLNILFSEAGFEINQKVFKRLLWAFETKTYYLYKTADNGEYSVPQYSAIIGEVYALHERTNSGSCMTKGSYDEEKGQADFYDGKLHPFHSYNTEDWDLFLLSDVAPDELGSWAKDKSPFLARSWGWTQYNGDSPVYCNAGRSYGDSQASDVLNATLCDKGANFGAKIRMYEAYYGDVSMPYIDGYTQYVGASTDEPNRSADGHEYFHAVVSDRGDYENTWEVDYSTGLAERVNIRYECQVSGEEHDEEEMCFVDSLDGYVHCEFYNYNAPDELDGLAILRYFRRNG